MDRMYMKMAIELAKRGDGFVSPNPLVGAVIVKNGEIIGKGFHARFGENHAEINALEDARKNNSDVIDATIYVTLEPCSHYGKTPPCAEALAKSGITKVIIGLIDPNPKVSGRGVELLKDNGIEVVVGILEDECRKINEVFLKYISTQSPFVILKYAMTLDGKISTSTGDSRWITNHKSREFVHKLRHKCSAIMVGIGTVLADNPSLNTRLDTEDARDPIRIIVDTRGKIPIDAKVINIDSNARAIVATTDLIEKSKLKSLIEKGVTVIVCPLLSGRVDLRYLLEALHKRGIDSILLEGGSELNFNMLKEDLVDKVISFIAPKLIGGTHAKTPVGGVGIELMRDAIMTERVTHQTFGDDLCIESYIKKR